MRLIAFHNAFNPNVKFVYGALACLDTTDADAARFTLPNGGEPWGNNISWRNLDAAVQTAAAFISEMGVVRSASSFEDYVTGATAELDRAFAKKAGAAASASGSSTDEEASDDDVPQLYPLLSRLRLNPENMAADLTLVKFFQIARNCVVHRSGRASPALAEISRSDELAAALKTWPRRKGKWLLAIPQIENGEPVSWLPRHAIMASACHHRCATLIDTALIQAIGVDGMVSMAAHWCFLADSPVPCPAKLDAQTMIRTQLVQRYLVRQAEMADVMQSLRETALWERTREVFGKLGILRVRDERKAQQNARPKKTRR